MKFLYSMSWLSTNAACLVTAVHYLLFSFVTLGTCDSGYLGVLLKISRIKSGVDIYSGTHWMVD